MSHVLKEPHEQRVGWRNNRKPHPILIFNSQKRERETGKQWKMIIIINNSSRVSLENDIQLRSDTYKDKVSYEYTIHSEYVISLI